MEYHKIFFNKHVLPILYKLNIVKEGDEEKKINLTNTNIDKYNNLEEYTYLIQFRNGFFKLVCDTFNDDANIIFVNDYSNYSPINYEDNFLIFYLERKITLLIADMDSKNNKKPRLA